MPNKPPKPIPSVWVTHEGRRFYVNGAPHVDSGFLTLLAQDGISGLQARHRDGTWLDVPPTDDGLAVNFGKVLERWCGGRIKATEHRVIGTGRERMSIPFFYEARADAEIRPLPMDDAALIRALSLRRLSVGDHDPVRRIQGDGSAAQADAPLTAPQGRANGRALIRP